MLIINSHCQHEIGSNDVGKCNALVKKNLHKSNDGIIIDIAWLWATQTCTIYPLSLHQVLASDVFEAVVLPLDLVVKRLEMGILGMVWGASMVVHLNPMHHQVQL